MKEIEGEYRKRAVKPAKGWPLWAIVLAVWSPVLLYGAAWITMSFYTNHKLGSVAADMREHNCQPNDVGPCFTLSNCKSARGFLYIPKPNTWCSESYQQLSDYLKTVQ